MRRGRRPYFGALAANESLSRSLYSRQLETLLEQFDRGQVLVLQFERASRIRPPSCGERTSSWAWTRWTTSRRRLTERVGGAHPRMDVPVLVAEAARQMILRDAARLKALVPEIDLDLWPSCRELDQGPSEGRQETLPRSSSSPAAVTNE